MEEQGPIFSVCFQNSACKHCASKQLGYFYISLSAQMQHQFHQPKHPSDPLTPNVAYLVFIHPHI